MALARAREPGRTDGRSRADRSAAARVDRARDGTLSRWGGRAMIAEWCACLVLSIPQSGADGFGRALELARAGDFGAAWTAAENTPDEGTRAQVGVYVRWQAGDLEGALSSAEWFSRRHP